MDEQIPDRELPSYNKNRYLISVNRETAEYLHQYKKQLEEGVGVKFTYGQVIQHLFNNWREAK